MGSASRRVLVGSEVSEMCLTGYAWLAVRICRAGSPTAVAEVQANRLGPARRRQARLERHRGLDIRMGTASACPPTSAVGLATNPVFSRGRGAPRHGGIGEKSESMDQEAFRSQRVWGVAEIEEAPSSTIPVGNRGSDVGRVETTLECQKRADCGVWRNGREAREGGSPPRDRKTPPTPQSPSSQRSAGCWVSPA